MTTSEYAKAQIATACWMAAKEELHQTMLCVCMVFLNRAKAGWFEGDLYENASQWLSENPGKGPDLRDPQFQQLLAKLDTVLSGLVTDKTGGALHWGPKSSTETLPTGFTITTTVGNMIFVR